MQRSMVWVAFFLMSTGVCFAADRTVTCESTDGYYRHCPVDIDGEVSLSRQLSQAPCQRDKSWGFDWKGIWVDDGCRAEFEVTTSATPGSSSPPRHSAPPPSSSYPSSSTPPSSTGDLVVCESLNHRRRYCEVDTGEGVELAKKLSRAACVEGQTWGYDRGGIWVDGGCRARFRVHRRYGPKPNQGPAGQPGGRDGQRLVRCESRGHRVVECRADTSAGVCLERQLSRVECIYGVNWGISRDKIWVDEGCGGEFLLGNRSPAGHHP